MRRLTGENLAVDISSLSRGTQLEKIEFELDNDYTRRYLKAVSGYSPVSLVTGIPSHALATRAVLALLEALSLPAGTVHVSQSATSHAEANFGAAFSMLTTVTQTRAVRGYMHISLSFDIYDGSGGEQLIVEGDTVVMVPLQTDGHR